MIGATLTDSQKKFLLKLARDTIKAELSGEASNLPLVKDPALLEHRGAFVTLHIRGQLRGCIGIFEASKALYEVVSDMALSAAFRDPRFPPLRPSEFPDIEIEISVLSPLTPVSDIEEIQVGVHGIYIIQGPFRGVLLPQVATQYGWDRQTFLDQTCVKAGLYPGCWKQPDTQILIFSAEIFSEETMGLRG